LGRSRKRHESDVFFAAFSTVMFLMATCWIVSDAMTGEHIWLLDRDYPGGPMAYLIGPPSGWYNRFRTVVTIIMQQMADGLMVSPIGLMQPADVNPFSDPGAPLSNRVGQSSCDHYTLHPVVGESR